MSHKNPPVYLLTKPLTYCFLFLFFFFFCFCFVLWFILGLVHGSELDCFEIPMEKMTSGSKVSEKVSAHSRALFRAPQFCHCSGLEKRGIILFALRLSMLSWLHEDEFKVAADPPDLPDSAPVVWIWSTMIVVLKWTNDLKQSMCIRVVVFIPAPDFECIVYLFRSIQSDVWIDSLCSGSLPGCFPLKCETFWVLLL